MPRASREQQAIHHRSILANAARLVRERGTEGFSVPEVMAASGLTAGGFYKHFASKEDLVARAQKAAFDERAATSAAVREHAPDRASARSRFVQDYLSTAHRDHPGRGCPVAALAADIGRRDTDDALRREHVRGIRALVETLGALGDADGVTRDGVPDGRPYAELATLVGAVLLARATAGDAMSEQFLSAARDQILTAGSSTGPGAADRPA